MRGPGRAPERLGRAWAVIAGGGTGGHLYPGVAVAQALMEMGHDQSSLRFVGARRGLEARTNALQGFPVTLLPGRGLSRRLGPADLWANVKAVASAVAALAMAVRLFGRWRPSVVVSLGGYASLACVGAAALWRAPVLVVNVDAVPGLVNRLSGRLAKACAVIAPGVPLPRAVVTGAPVRPAMERVDRSPEGRLRARAKLGLPADARVVAVSGGSLGALRVNRATVGLVSLWAARADVAIRHVVGQRDFAQMQAMAPAPLTGGLLYQQVAYEEDMASVYAAADVAVQRAGANTVAELALAGVPAVLVPLPGAPGDHQGANARAMAAAGAAVVVPDAELDGERLAAELDALWAQPGRLAAMGAAASSLGRPGAARRVAELAEDLARWPGSTSGTVPTGENGSR